MRPLLSAIFLFTPTTHAGCSGIPTPGQTATDCEFKEAVPCREVNGCEWEDDPPQIQIVEHNEQPIEIVQGKPEMYPITPDHCVMTSAYSIAHNLVGKTKWNEVLWNTRADEIDKLFQGTNGYKKMHQAAEYGTKGMLCRKCLKCGGGGFHPAFEQMMFRTVGLNFGLVKRTMDHYPDTWHSMKLKVLRSFGTDEFAGGEGKKGIDFWMDILSGKTTFMNSAGTQQPALGIIIGINCLPYGRNYDHDVAIIKLHDHWWYLDSNVREFQHVKADGGNPGMTNKYMGHSINNNRKTVKDNDKDWKQGYLVDYSLDLGDKIDIAATWIHSKMTRDFRDTGNEETPTNAGGGGMWWSVIVEDKPVIKWKDIVKKYKGFAKSKEPLSWQKGRWNAQVARSLGHDNLYQFKYDLNDDVQNVPLNDHWTLEEFLDENPEEILFGAMAVDLSLIIGLAVFICMAIGICFGYWAIGKF